MFQCSEWSTRSIHVSSLFSLSYYAEHLLLSHYHFYRKWFLKKIGCEGVSACVDITSQSFFIASHSPLLRHQGIQKLLSAHDDKSATAVCTFAYSNGVLSDPIHLFCGKTEVCFLSDVYNNCNYLPYTCTVQGRVVPPAGPRDFGWDPIFQPVGFEMTYVSCDKHVI